MKRFLLELSWLDRFLPLNLKPAPEEIFEDKASIDLIKETELVFDRLIEQGSPYKTDRTIKKIEHEYSIIIKISKKQIRLHIQDEYHTKARYKKRIEIVCIRKHVKNENGEGVCSEAAVHYLKNQRTYVSSIRETPIFRPIFKKIAELDDVLSGKKVKKALKQESPTPNQLTKHEDEITAILNEAKQMFKIFNDQILEPLLESRLRQIVIETEKLLPNLSFLEIEDRYTLKRMFREDIPNLLQTYVSLSSKNRQSHTEDVFVSLSKMELAIIGYQEKVEKEKVQKMEQLLKLNELRYSTEQKQQRGN
ncbi:MAG TPA: hypothetical protein GX525_09440 [Bacilli bacterium]|nr:hypothetical protein [Bacilli bacterium]